MSVESEILRIQRNVANTYAKVAEKGGTVPTQPNSANLAAAVASIPESGDAYLVRAPIGTIVAWSGTADNIPTGWHLCNGEDGTLDLRDKFLFGAGAHPVGETGGSETVTLTLGQMPSHVHGVPGSIGTGDGENRYIIGKKLTNSAIATTPSGSSQPHPNMPPYYTLCWIQKVTAEPTDGVTQAELTEALEGKQDALTGTQGQVVGFDAAGKAVAKSGIATETYVDDKVGDIAAILDALNGEVA